MDSAPRVDGAGREDASALDAARDDAKYYASVAALIDTTFRPRTVLDVGCGIGLLVGALRERGIDARGVDRSEGVISQVPRELAPYCSVASVTEEIAGTYDLVTCLEVLQHVPFRAAERAIENLARLTDRVLFSSTPDNVVEAGHINVRPPSEWIQRFGVHGFLPTATMATLAVSPHAIVFERREPEILDALGTYELVRYRLARDLQRDRIDNEGTRHRLSRDLETARQGELKARAERDAADRMVEVLKSRIVDADSVIATLSAELGLLRAELDLLRASSWWRLGRPLRASVAFVRTRILAPRHADSGAGTPSVGGSTTLPPPVSIPPARAATDADASACPLPDVVPAAVEAADLPSSPAPLLRPLAVFPVPTDGFRYVTVVIERLDAASSIDRGDTSLTLAVMMAARLDALLRIVVTGREDPDPANFAAVLSAHDVDWERNVEVGRARFEPGAASLPYRSGEVFLTTSWQTAWAASRSVDPWRVVYLLQEDEGALCRTGEERKAHEEVMTDPRIRFAVETLMLRDHLVGHGRDAIAEHGVAFEPAFPRSSFFRQPRGSGERQRFLFSAAAENATDLVELGLDAIREATSRGILDRRRWDVHHVGTGPSPAALQTEATPSVSDLPAQPDYATLLRRVDVGLSLKNAPHPGHPNLAVAACGGVALTNRFGSKQTLEHYSRNILCVDASVEALVEGIASAVRLSEAEPLRTVNYESQQLSRDWNSSLEPILERLLGDF